MTIGQLAKQHGLSRSTLLYYIASGCSIPRAVSVCATATATTQPAMTPVCGASASTAGPGCRWPKSGPC